MLYNYGSLIVEFDSLPSLRPQLLKTTDIGSFLPLDALRGASAKRYFCLEEDWIIKIKVNSSQYDDIDTKNISGTILIPKFHPDSEAKIKLDGASVPLPWLVSFLSFGILRPLGVMLTASIVHDFAFEYGCLYYCEEQNSIQPRDIRRDLADQLFYDMIKTVNNMPLTAYIAWLAVRLGWFFVKYNNQAMGGKPPYKALSIVLLLVLILLGLIKIWSLVNVLYAISIIYISIFLLLQITAPSKQKQSNI